MSQVLALLSTILSLLDKFVAWGARNKVFKEDEAIIASKILGKALEDLKLVKESNARLDAQFESDPSSIMRPDEFTRPD